MRVLLTKSQAPQLWWIHVRIIPALFLVIVGLCILGEAAWVQWQNNRATAWPSVPGVIVNSTLGVRHGRRRATYYTPWVAYRYAVAGVTHVGHRIVFGAADTDRRRAEELVAHYRVGMSTWVYLDPRDVNSSLLEHGPMATLTGGIPAGFLLAAVAWSMPTGRGQEFWITFLFTYFVGLGHFSHVVAGSGEAWLLALNGRATFGWALFGFIVPAAVGNVLGGTVQFALLAHAQVRQELSKDDA